MHVCDDLKDMKKGIGIKSENVCKQVRDQLHSMEKGSRYHSRIAIKGNKF